MLLGWLGNVYRSLFSNIPMLWNETSFLVSATSIEVAQQRFVLNLQPSADNIPELVEM